MKVNELLGFCLLFVFLVLMFYVGTASPEAFSLDQKTHTLLFGELCAFAGIYILIKEQHRQKKFIAQ